MAKNTRKTTTKRKKTRTKAKPRRTKKQEPWLTKLKNFSARFFQQMGMLSIFFILFAILSGIIIFRFWQTSQDYVNQPSQEQADYEAKVAFIEQLAPTAQRLQRQYGVLASVSLAQAALESNFGQSQLSADYNNLYGVKTDETDPDGVDLPTLEYVNDEWIEVIGRFKVYQSWDAAMESHAQLINQGTSWDAEFYQAVLDGTTYHEQARGLQQAGYATDPTYSDKIIEMIESFNLSKYDQPLTVSQ